MVRHTEMIYRCLGEKNVRALGKEGFPVKSKFALMHMISHECEKLQMVFFNATFYRELLWGEFDLIALIDLLFKDCN